MAGYQCDAGHEQQADVLITMLVDGQVLAMCAEHAPGWALGYVLEAAAADGLSNHELVAAIAERLGVDLSAPVELTQQAEQPAPSAAQKSRRRATAPDIPPSQTADDPGADSPAGGTPPVPDPPVVAVDTGPVGG